LVLKNIFLESKSKLPKRVRFMRPPSNGFGHYQDDIFWLWYDTN
jgi:hypothetical protein